MSMGVPLTAGFHARGLREVSQGSDRLGAVVVGGQAGEGFVIVAYVRVSAHGSAPSAE
jgi:hypothetical protein